MAKKDNFDTMKEKLENLKTSIELEKERISQLKDEEEIKTRNESLSKKIAEYEKKQYEYSEKRAVLLKKISDYGIQLSDEQKKELKRRQDELRLLEQKSVERKKSEEQYKEDLKEQKRLLNEINEEAKEQQRFVESSVSRLSRNILGIDKETSKKSFIGRMLEGGFSDIGTQLRMFGTEIAKTLTPTNLLVGSIQKVAESTLYLAREQEAAITSFNKATGAAGEYNDALSDLGFKHLSLGIDTNLASEAMQTLREEYVDFNLISMDMRQELALTSAEFSQIGIDSRLFAKNIGIMTKQLGMSAKQAQKTQKELVGMSKQLSMSPSKIVSDFEAAAPRLAAQGNKIVEAFKGLTIAAKATGLSIDKILQITEQFDTFEGAGEAVSRLNSILRGPYLDAMEMLETTDPTERFKKLKNAISQAGQSYDQLSYYQQKAMASAMGTDVATMAQMMTADLEKEAEASKATAISQKQLNDLIQEGLPVWQKFQKLALSMAMSMRWIIEPISKLLDKILELNEATNGWLTKIVALTFGIPILLLFGSKIKSLIIKPFQMLSGVFSNTKKPLEEVAEKMKKDAPESIDKMGQAAKRSWKEIMALGAAILMIGGGIALATLGIAKLAEAMKGMTSLEIGGLIGTLVVLGVTFAGLAFLATVVSGPLMALGAAILMIGGGIALATLGIAKLAEAMKGMSGEAAISIVGIMASITASISALSIASPLAALGVLSLAAGFATLSVSLALIKTEDLKNVSIMFNAISKLSYGTVSALKEVTSSIKQIANAMDEIPSDKAIHFTSVIESIRKIGEQGTKNVETRETIKTTLAETINSVNSISKISNNSNNQNMTSKSSQTGISGERTIVIQLGDRVLKKFVIDLLDEKLSASKIY